MSLRDDVLRQQQDNPDGHICVTYDLVLNVLDENERLRGLLRDIADSGAFVDDRVRYVDVQVDRSTWDDLQAFAAAPADGPTTA